MFLKCFLLVFILGSLNALELTRQCRYPHLDNGRVRMRQRSKLVKFICYPHYELVGNKYATCRNGEWDVPLPVCVRPNCAIPQINNGIQMPMRRGAWVVFFCLPGFKLAGSPVIYCDGRKWNATAPVCVDTATPNRLSCDFEDPDLCGWTQDELHDFDWRRWNKKTPSSFLYTGPSYDHTFGKFGSGFYMYIESTSRLDNDTARLISPIYDAALTKNGCFSFFYHMFGKTTGGLRVYQKPENYPLQSLLNLTEYDRQKYVLFEKWGNQGDFWYSDVSMLKNFSDSFQIVIEGIRGTSFTSDIAIDDVAILQRDNCTAAKIAATTPAIVMPDSCTNRCNVFGIPATELGCGCTASCLADDNCCPDFFDLCVFVSEATIVTDEISQPTSRYSFELAPQTQKLVATTPESTTSPQTTTTATTRITTTVTTTTRAPITTTKRTTVTSTTSTNTSPVTATTITYNTTIKHKDNPNKTNVFMHNTTTTTTTTTTKALKKTTTVLPYGISRTIDNHDVYHEMLEKAKKEQLIETRTEKKVEAKMINTDNSKRSGSNGLKTSLIAITSLLCCLGVLYFVFWSRSARGRATIASLRGQTQRDPEVRYLTTDVDEY